MIPVPEPLYAALFRSLSERESAETAADLASDPSVAESVRRHYRRIDIVAEGALRTSTALACQEGCSYCCHRWVMASPAEVFTVGEAILATRGAERRGFIERVHHNARRAREASAQGDLHRAPRCALLDDDDRCGAYEQRPSQCRRHHSTDLDACLSAYLDAFQAGQPFPSSRPYETVGAAAEAGLMQGLRQRGLETRRYELQSALSEYLEDAFGCVARFVAGKPSFRHAMAGPSPASCPEAA